MSGLGSRRPNSFSPMSFLHTKGKLQLLATSHDQCTTRKRLKQLYIFVSTAFISQARHPPRTLQISHRSISSPSIGKPVEWSLVLRTYHQRTYTLYRKQTKKSSTGSLRCRLLYVTYRMGIDCYV